MMSYRPKSIGVEIYWAINNSKDGKFYNYVNSYGSEVVELETHLEDINTGRDIQILNRSAEELYYIYKIDGY